MPPERVRMDVAEVVDVGDVDARGVSAPLRELGPQVRLELWEPAARPQQQINAVRIVVAGHELFVETALDMAPARVEQDIHRAPRGFEHRVVLAVDVAAPGV